MNQDLPSWFRAGSTTPHRHAAAVLRGLHPFGRPLSAVPGATCGNCAFVAANEMRGGAVFYKCALDRSSWTCGPATDLRLKWRACDRHQGGEGGVRR